MKRFLYKRQSPDWLAINTREKFLSQKFDVIQHDWDWWLKALWPLTLIWKDTLTVDYFHYRQKLKEIAEVNLFKTDSILVKSHEDLRGKYILLCVDDDDWFAANIFSMIANDIKDDTDVIIWHRTILNYGDLNPWETHDDVLFTNNYALTNSGVKKLLDNNISPFTLHSHIHECVFDKKNRFNILRIKHGLSLTNKTLASTIKLIYFMPSVEHFRVALRAMPNYVWAYPPNGFKAEIDELNALHASIELKQPRKFYI